MRDNGGVDFMHEMVYKGVLSVVWIHLSRRFVLRDLGYRFGGWAFDPFPSHIIDRGPRQEAGIDRCA